MVEDPLIRSTSKRRGRYTSVWNSACRRLIRKTGDSNITGRYTSRQNVRLVQDFFTTMVDSPWRWIILLLTFSFFSTWFIFGLLWWLIALVHGDLVPEHLPQHQAEIGWIPCVTNIYNITSCFMFSMENQHTTGFGSRMPTEECPEAIFLMCVQAIVGVTVQTAMLGIVFAKIIRSKQRTKTILFSEKAVICLYNGHLCLMFRVADMRKSHIIGTRLSVLLVAKHMAMEDELVTPYTCELRINSVFYLLWPETVIHRIDEKSPLYTMSADDLRRSDFEIVIVLEGTIESTDQRVQARSSYLPSEIVWGYRFHSLLNYDRENRTYEAKYGQLNAIYKADIPPYSAKRIKELLQQNPGFDGEEKSASPAPVDSEQSVILAHPSGSSEV